MLKNHEQRLLFRNNKEGFYKYCCKQEEHKHFIEDCPYVPLIEKDANFNTKSLYLQFMSDLSVILTYDLEYIKGVSSEYLYVEHFW